MFLPRICVSEPTPLKSKASAFCHALYHTCANDASCMHENGMPRAPNIVQARAFEICNYCLHLVGGRDLYRCGQSTHNGSPEAPDRPRRGADPGLTSSGLHSCVQSRDILTLVSKFEKRKVSRIPFVKCTDLLHSSMLVVCSLERYIYIYIYLFVCIYTLILIYILQAEEQIDHIDNHQNSLSIVS